MHPPAPPPSPAFDIFDFFFLKRKIKDNNILNNMNSMYIRWWAYSSQNINIHYLPEIIKVQIIANLQKKSL